MQFSLASLCSTMVFLGMLFAAFSGDTITRIGILCILVPCFVGLVAVIWISRFHDDSGRRNKNSRMK